MDNDKHGGTGLGGLGVPFPSPTKRTEDKPNNMANANGAGTGGSRAGDIPSVDIQPNGNKYSGALKTLLPYRSSPSKKKNNVLPSSKSGLFSFATASWLSKLMWKAFRQGLTPADLWDLREIDKAEPNAKRLSKLWEEEKRAAGDNASFTKAVWRFGKTRFYVCIFLMIVSVIFQFLGPAWILKSILTFTEDLSQPMEIGLLLAFLAFIAQLTRNLTFNGLWMMGIHTGMRIEGAMQFMTYEKMLRLRNGGDKVLSQAITFCTNDQERIFECVAGGVMAFAAPVMFLMCIIYTTVVLGPWALLGNLVIFLFYPVMGTVARFIAVRRRRTVKVTNQRVGLMNEILNSIRLIKIYGWETNFSTKIKGIRNNEEDLLKKVAFMQSLTSTLTPMVNIVASILTFVGYSLSGNNLTAAEAFTIFSVFAAMQFTIGTLPFAARSIGESVVCFRNFQKYLALPEFIMDTDENLQCNHDSVIAIEDGSFAWENEEGEEELDQQESQPRRRRRKQKKEKTIKEDGKNEPISPIEPEEVALTKTKELIDCLHLIQLEVKRGSLVGLCGSVGSGKSSLLSAIVGDMVKTKGKFLIRGSLAVVSQEAWIFSDTLQENILFGTPLNSEKYQKVLEVCCLNPDLEKLPHKDLTLIGERGVNLSGGQKARVNLARAVYADKSIYLLDDPLAAVDPIVAKKIYESCIRDYLSDKTVLLVTHSVQFLESCDEILVMKDGSIVERGTHSTLLEKKEHYQNFLHFHNVHKHESNMIYEDDEKVKNGTPSIGAIGRTISNLSSSPRKKNKTKAAEELESIVQKLTDDDTNYKFAGIKSYLIYLKASGGYLFSIGVFLAFAAFVFCQIFTQVWLQRWIDAGDGLMEERKQNATAQNITLSKAELKGYVNDNPDISLYMTVLVVSVLISYIVGLGKGFLSVRLVLWASSCLHGKMIDRVMGSTMTFFDDTPIGKITNRFSKDMDELDARMPFFFEFVVQSILYVLFNFLVVCMVYPYFCIALFCILATMVFFDVWLNYGVRETKRLEVILKTPVIHHIQSSMGGLSIIRTFSRQDNFKIRFANYLNHHLSAESVFRFANRWFTVRVEFLGLATIVGTILLAVFLRGYVSPASVGLALTSIYSVCTFVPFVLRMKSELQARFISVERIIEYSQEIAVEEPQDRPSSDPPQNWPKEGKIVFENVNLRYKENAGLVFNGVSFSTKAGEKIGIVGRTGAGKTSILSTLLRLYPIESGKVLIDGVDVSLISLKSLRSNIAVIPQDPVLFQGTIRSNLDLFDEYTDNEIWDVLERTQLKSTVEREDKRLLAPVMANGENFSLGEKQLMSLARAMLRKNKIIFLDEATSALDVEIDYKIQEIIRDAFTDCTVITIAHRLNTIVNYDRIMVMDLGKVVEFDTPANLMKNEDSLFRKMMEVSGIPISSLSHNHKLNNETSQEHVQNGTNSTEENKT